jgi:hypothetical protein
VYHEGFTRVVECQRGGGWSAVEQRAGARATSRDLMHPDGGHVPPEPLPPPPIDLPASFTLADRDTLGEQGVVVLISTWTGKDNLGLLAGEGWRGDALFRWESAAPETGVTLWVTRWVSEDEARDFVYAYRRGLEARFPGVAPIEAAGGGVRYAERDRAVTITMNGAEVWVDVRPSPREVEAPRKSGVSGF